MCVRSFVIISMKIKGRYAFFIIKSIHYNENNAHIEYLHSVGKVPISGRLCLCQIVQSVLTIQGSTLLPYFLMYPLD